MRRYQRLPPPEIFLALRPPLPLVLIFLFLPKIITGASDLLLWSWSHSFQPAYLVEKTLSNIWFSAIFIFAGIWIWNYFEERYDLWPEKNHIKNVKEV